MKTKIMGKRVLITGGASGIGLCAAEEFARGGAELVLTDVNVDGLAAAAKQLQGLGATVHTRVVDVSDRAAVNELARWVIDQYDEHGRLTAISDQELETKAKELMPDYWKKYKGDS